MIARVAPLSTYCDRMATCCISPDSDAFRLQPVAERNKSDAREFQEQFRFTCGQGRKGTGTLCHVYGQTGFVSLLLERQ